MKFQKNTLSALVLAALLAPTAALAQDAPADAPDAEFTGGEFTGDWQGNDMDIVADGFIAVAEDFAKRDAALVALAADLEEAKDHIKATNTNLTHAINTKVSKAAYDADKKKIEDTVNPLVEGVNRLSEETLKVKDKTNATAQKVDDLEFAVNGAVEAVKAKVDQAQYDEDKKLIGGAFKEVKDAILTIQDDMDDVNGWFKSFDEHKANKEEVNAQVGALEDHIKATNTNLTHAINTKVSKAAYDADKKKIEDTVNPLIEGVNRLAEETLKVKDKANSTAQKVDDLEFAVNGAVEAVKTKADKADLDAKADKTALEAKADKADLEAKADKADLDAKANAADVYTKVESDAIFAKKADAAAVSANGEIIKDNTRRIAGLETQVTGLEAQVAGLDNRVNVVEKDLKRGLASQAALAGLFQPYNVGKVNVTAAVGGYKSETAVALGAGYRVNEKFAAKAGFTLGSGSSAYNVSVNYEF